jgi:tagatose 1,6-diphosphate aldolase
MGRLAGRPWVMLSAGAGKAEFRNVLEHAFKAGASGFLAGRAIWLDAFTAYPDWAAVRAGLEGDAGEYMKDISALADAKAANWAQHSCYGAGGARLAADDAGFRNSYADI